MYDISSCTRILANEFFQASAGHCEVLAMDKSVHMSTLFSRSDNSWWCVTTLETSPAPTVSGKKRGRGSAAYDFKLCGRRVEVKSAQLAWNKDKVRWNAYWRNIKPEEHDDLYLALYTPSGVHIYLHDGVYGVTTNGKAQAASGGIVQAFGPRCAPGSWPLKYRDRLLMTSNNVGQPGWASEAVRGGSFNKVSASRRSTT